MFQKRNSYAPCLLIGRGLELLDRVFFGVPGGEGIGVGPFPFALLSPIETEQNNKFCKKSLRTGTKMVNTWVMIQRIKAFILKRVLI